MLLLVVIIISNLFMEHAYTADNFADTVFLVEDFASMRCKTAKLRAESFGFAVAPA